MLMKDIRHPFGNFNVGTIHTVCEWLDLFRIDWLSQFENKITNNQEWFKK